MPVIDHHAKGPAALAQAIAGALDAAIARRGVALIAVSGGKSPIPLFAALRDEAVDWRQVIVTLVDERWVAPDHPDSNERLVRETLLIGPAAAARFVPMKNDAVDPPQGQPAFEAALAALPRPFDLILLGMGEDGHTASLFPGAAELPDALTTDMLSIAVTPPAAPHPRLSLTLSGLLDSRLILLPIAGATKRAVYAAAQGDGPIDQMPIRAVLRQHRVPVQVWIDE